MASSTNTNMPPDQRRQRFGHPQPLCLWVPGTRPWSLTCGDVGQCWVLVYRILYRFVASLARLAVRAGRSKDLEIVVLRHQLGVLRRQVDRPEFTDADRSLLGAIAAALARPSRVAGHPRHTVALTPAPHRRALDLTTSTAGPAIDLSEASPTRTAPRS